MPIILKINDSFMELSGNGSAKTGEGVIHNESHPSFPSLYLNGFPIGLNQILGSRG